MDRRRAFGAFALALAAAAGCMPLAAADLPACPPTVEAAQELRGASNGWTAVPFIGPLRLARMTFKLADDPGELRPDDDRVVAGKRILAWEVAGMATLQQVCEYAGTQAKLSRPVAGTWTRCELTLASSRPDAAVVSAICK